ncbi:MAG: nucleotide exchange factor GrpE [Kiritimatiellae bacterium]|nr:nucleotide exchange factor GrpE [Kiritimatiellia bacterium]
MTKKSDITTDADPELKEVPPIDDAPAEPKRAKAKKPSKGKKKKAAAAEAQSKSDEDADKANEAAGDAVAVLSDRLLRLQADFDNFRKRTQREREDLYRMANEDLMAELLPVIDHMQLALDAAGDDAQSQALSEGVKLVMGQLDGALTKFNLEPIDAVGETFDPNLHEALSQAPSTDVDEHVVMFQHRRGYKLGSKLLRAAQVVVSAGPGPNGGAEADDADESPIVEEES